MGFSTAALVATQAITTKSRVVAGIKPIFFISCLFSRGLQVLHTLVWWLVLSVLPYHTRRTGNSQSDRFLFSKEEHRCPFAALRG